MKQTSTMSMAKARRFIKKYSSEPDEARAAGRPDHAEAWEEALQICRDYLATPSKDRGRGPHDPEHMRKMRAAKKARRVRR